MSHRTACVPVLALLAALGVGVPRLSAFDIIECDGNSTFGDAAILLGWTDPTVGSIGTIVLDNQGAALSGLTGTDLIGAWESGMADWQDTTNQAFAFPSPRAQRAVTQAEALATISDTRPSSERLFFTVQPDGTGGRPTGWSSFALTDPCATLAVTLVRFEPTSRRIEDGDMMVNDDDECATPPPGGLFSNLPTPGKFHLPSVLLHELGHFVGGDHSDVAGATMEPSIAPGATFNLINDDENILRFLHATVAGPTPPSRNDLNLTTCLGGGGGGGGGIPPGKDISGGGGWCSVEPTGTFGFYPASLVLLLAALRVSMRRSPGA